MYRDLENVAAALSDGLVAALGDGLVGERKSTGAYSALFMVSRGSEALPLNSKQRLGTISAVVQRLAALTQTTLPTPRISSGGRGAILFPAQITLHSAACGDARKER